MKNRLAESSSPYLRQHAGNPVHWQRWDATALERARHTDTPILLSIGYSACHWCHVMAHESFEDAAIADVMNESFVNIKLDREERPDLDRVYQLAHQALSGRGGGWPLTVFLDPQDLTPFFVGTYFPPAPRHGLPGFTEVLEKVRAYFDAHRDQLRQQNIQLREWLARVEQSTPGDVPPSSIIDTALQRIAARFDPDNGGSRGAPKFPHAGELELLLDVLDEPLSLRERGRGQGSEETCGDITMANPHPALRATFSRREQENNMARLTLQAMAARGLQDHLGGGFFRYCVDAQWTIPHFEKMLYDNAQLLPLFARAASTKDIRNDARAARASEIENVAMAAQRFDDAASVQAATGIADWLQQEMTASNGAFFSALDADSRDEQGRLQEGAYYVWTREEIRAALTSEVFAAVEIGYGLDAPANFEGHAWHLVKAATLEQIASTLDRSTEATQQLLGTARRKLFDTRAKRTRPASDDKILTAWNALTIAGLARAARALDKPEWLAYADYALQALCDGAWIDDALYANVAESASRIPGFLDDHAFLLDALLEMLQCRWRDVDLAWAIALTDAMLLKFEDKQHGGFWFSADQHATPLQQSKTFTDDSLPSGNGVAVRALLRLGHLLGETRYLDAAERALRASHAALEKYPDACPTLLRGLREFHAPRMQIVIRCDIRKQKAWRDALHAGMEGTIDRDRIDVFVIPDDAASPTGLLAKRKTRKNGVAYVCEGMSCRAPVTSLKKLVSLLRERDNQSNTGLSGNSSRLPGVGGR
ncbi:MAG: thioredoxin domain-containing protein [Rhodanobacteraceae bacterium]